MADYKSSSGGHSPEEIQRLRRLFDTVDKNHNGRIDIDEFLAALKSRAHETSAKDQWYSSFLKHDTNKDGSIDFDEFVQYVQEHEDKLRLHFRSIDANRDGKISVLELQDVFQRLGIHLDKDEAQKLMTRMDQDGDLTIDWVEWRDYLLLSPCDQLQDILTYWKRSTIIDIGENTTIPDDFTEKEMKTGQWWRQLIAGGIAGAASRTFTAPLDRLKIMLQIQDTKQPVSMWGNVRNMYHEGGIRSLWRGNAVNVLKIAPETALKFMAYEQIKKLIMNKNDGEITVGGRFLAGSTAGALSQTIIYPMEVLKTRLAIAKTGQYNGIMDCAIKLFKKEGFRIFYRGYAPNIFGIIPYAGIDLAVYETMKKFYMGKTSDKDTGVLVSLVCGSTSCTAGQMASYPLALVRTKLQAQVPKEGEKAQTMIGIFKKIIREEGIKGLYRGVCPNFLKVLPAINMSYIVYGYAKKSLGIPD